MPHDSQTEADIADASMPTDVADEDEKPVRISFIRWIAEMVGLVAVAFLLATAIKTWVVQPFIIPSGSMVPTLEISDRVLVNKFLYRFSDPRPGDIVVFLEPGSDSTDYIKRVIAIDGQTVDINDGKVSVDGVTVPEGYTRGLRTDDGDVAMPYVVPEESVFLMGDNRPNSRDSRWFGAQPTTRVLGKAFAIYWPPSRIRLLR